MIEKDLDKAIESLQAIRQTLPEPAHLDQALKALKEYRQKRMHWKNLVRGIRVVQRFQKKNQKDTDNLIEALLK